MKKMISWILAILLSLPLLTVLPGKALADDVYLLINETTFPDETFRNWIINHLDTETSSGGDRYMTEAQAKSVVEIDVSGTSVESLKGIERFVNLAKLNCDNTNISSLDVSANKALSELHCEGNHLSVLELSKLDNLQKENAFVSGQTVSDRQGMIRNGVFSYDLTEIVPKNMLTRVVMPDSSIRLNQTTGIVTFPGKPESFTYEFKTVKSNSGDIELPELPATRGNEKDIRMDVTVSLTFAEPEPEPEPEPLPAFDGTIEWNAQDVSFRGTTPYVIANGSAQTPRFTVKDKDGKTVAASNYTYEYLENKNAGTGYVIVTFTDRYSGTARAFFKIYLPATVKTSVENVSGGIRISWTAVEGAAGYVIYRRAWNLKDAGWTTFERWNNTTGLSWTDTKVYAGTRYQYGVKAYFARRTDPVSGAQIGGNVGDNFNLGMVGPLKTTVRITTRKLNSVTPGRKQLTIKWAGSSVFTGYQVQIATNAAFTKNASVVKITNAKTYQTVVKNLKAKTIYYVRVRSYHEFDGMTYFGEWSNVLSGKTK